MIAPTNCNPYCDCAQLGVRCQRAAEQDCIDAVSRSAQPHQVEFRKQHAIERSVADHSMMYEGTRQRETPPYVIPASLGVAPVSCVEVTPDGITEVPATDIVFTSQYPGAVRNSDLETHLVGYIKGELRERLIRAFRTCELDCGMWSDNALNELADIAIATLEAT